MKAGTRAIAILSVVRMRILQICVVVVTFSILQGLLRVWIVDGWNIQSGEGQALGEAIQHSSTLAFTATKVGPCCVSLT